MPNRRTGRQRVTIENGSPPASYYQSLDRKIDAVERDFRVEIGAIRTEMRDGNNAILDKIDRTSKPTSPYQLIGTAFIIITALGSAGAYVVSNQNATIVTVSTTLTADIAANSKSIKDETKSRTEDQLHIYELIGKNAEKEWSKDAQTEFEKRIDERNQLEQSYEHETFARIDRRDETLQNNIVPRAEHEQRWIDEKASQDRNDRMLAGSIDRLAEHVNKSDEGTSLKFSDIEKVIHGYGIADELKDLQAQLRDIGDKVFRWISSSERPDRSKTPEN